MRDDRGAKGGERGAPMTRIEMIGGREFDQFFATGKSLRQLVREIEIR